VNQPLTAETITDSEIRELLKELQEEKTAATLALRAMGVDLRRQNRARCAEILNKRRSR
jgi:hypothetical protein